MQPVLVLIVPWWPAPICVGGLLGPLHTRAKSHDLEIVRAQKKVSVQGYPKTPPKSYSSVVTTLKCHVKSYVTGPSTKCYFNECVFMQVLTHDKIEQESTEALSFLMADYISSCPLCSCQSMAIYYTYNQTFLGFCVPSSQMWVKD